MAKTIVLKVVPRQTAITDSEVETVGTPRRTRQTGSSPIVKVPPKRNAPSACLVENPEVRGGVARNAGLEDIALQAVVGTAVAGRGGRVQKVPGRTVTEAHP